MEVWYRNCIKVSLGPGSSTPRSHKMSTKVIRQLLVFVLVFTMFTAHQVCGEKDCYDERDSVKIDCKNTLKLGTQYAPPSDSCCHTVRQSDMVCICHVLSVRDEQTVSVYKLLKLARDCQNSVPRGTRCGSK